MDKIICLLFLVLFAGTLKVEGTFQKIPSTGAVADLIPGSRVPFRDSFSELNPPVYLSSPLLAISDDFDGDHVPDLVYTSGNGGQSDLYIKLSSRSRIERLAYGGGKLWLKLEGFDINNDHFLDLVLTGISPAIPAAIFLGDGKGNFKRADSWNFVGARHRPRHNLSLPASSRIEVAAILSNCQEQFAHLWMKYQPPIRRANLLATGNGWVHFSCCPSSQSSPRSPPVS